MAICNVPKLEDLYMTISCSSLFIPLNGLENHTVKKLKVVGNFSVATCWLLKMFRGVESVNLNYRPTRNFGDPSNIPNRTIDKIKFEQMDGPVNLNFAPRLVPVNVQRFESAV